MGGLLAGAGVVAAVMSSHQSHNTSPAPAAQTAAIDVRPIAQAPAAPVAPVRKAHAKQQRRQNPASQPTEASPPTVSGPAQPQGDESLRVAASNSRAELIDPYADDAKSAAVTTEPPAAATPPVKTEPLPNECKQYEMVIDLLAHECHDEHAKPYFATLSSIFHDTYDNWDSKRSDVRSGLAQSCPTLTQQLHSSQTAKLRIVCDAE